MKSLSKHIFEKLLVNKNYNGGMDCESELDIKYEKINDIITKTDWDFSSDPNHYKISLKEESVNPSKKILDEIRNITNSINKSNQDECDGWLEYAWYGTTLVTKKKNSSKYIEIEISSRDDTSFSYNYRSSITINIVNLSEIKQIKKSYDHKIPGDLIREIASVVSNKYNFEYLRK